MPTSNGDSNSPDCSFRLSGRSSCSSEELQENETSTKFRTRSKIVQGLSQKLSLDSGFSDSSESHIIYNMKRDIEEEQRKENMDSPRRDIEEGKRKGSEENRKREKLEEVANKRQGSVEKRGEGEEGRRREGEEGRKLKSAVVHETHALSNSSKMHHVSKVYFYSVSDILQESGREYEDREEMEPIHLSDQHPTSNPSTPRISAPVSELDYLDMMMRSSPQIERSPRVRTGTSSLRRKHRREEKDRSGRSSPLMRSNTPTHTFPITNGSLYSDLSLNRKVAENQRARRREERDSFNLTTSSIHSDLDSFDNPLDASQHSSNTSFSPGSNYSFHTPSTNPSSHPSLDIQSLSNHSSLSTSLPLEAFGVHSTFNRLVLLYKTISF